MAWWDFEERFQIPLEIQPLSSVEGPHPRGMMALVLRDIPSPQEGDTEAQNTHVILGAPISPTLTPRAWHLAGAQQPLWKTRQEATCTLRGLLSKPTQTSSFSGTARVPREPKREGQGWVGKS